MFSPPYHNILHSFESNKIFMYLIHTNALQEAFIKWDTIAQIVNGLQ